MRCLLVDCDCLSLWWWLCPRCGVMGMRAEEGETRGDDDAHDDDRLAGWLR